MYEAESDLRVETVPCDTCGAFETLRLFEAEDVRYGNHGTFQLVRCASCELVYLNPRPVPSDLDRFYPTDYVPHKSTAEYESRLAAWLRAKAFDPNGGQNGLAAWLHNSLAYRAFVARQQPGRILDIGCGTGEYLRQWRKLGWNVAGIEAAPKAAEISARVLGIDITCSAIEDVELPASSFDVITLCHTLEHVSSPTRVLSNVRQALRPGGTLLVMVPNFAGLDRMLFGGQWLGLEVPRHLYHFEPHTLIRTCRTAGFSKISVHGSSEATVILKTLRHVLRLPRSWTPNGVLRLGLASLLLPLAAVRRSSHLWAVAPLGNRE